VETGPADQVYETPSHPYTRMLMASTLVTDPQAQAQRTRERRLQGKGELPSPLSPPPGCAFNTRCAWAGEGCRSDMPQLQPAFPGVQAACHHLARVAATPAGQLPRPQPAPEEVAA